VQIYEPGEFDPITPPEETVQSDDPDDPIPPVPGADETIVDQPPDITTGPGMSESRKVYVDGVTVSILAERVEYLDADGKLVTESLRDFTKKALQARFVSLDGFLKRWKGPSVRSAKAISMTSARSANVESRAGSVIERSSWGRL
jgi:type I restriction enzyme R subunit